MDENEQPYSLLSQCYCNLGLLESRFGNYEMAMTYAEKDLQYKRKINANQRLYAGSLGHYALYQKERDPFVAVETYIDVIKLKRKNIECANNLRFERDKYVDIKIMRSKLTASWATGVFNLGLLAKDLLFYELASELIFLANEYRYAIINNISKDYNSSCNVAAELSILLHKNQDIQSYINAVEGRINMDPKLSTTLYHSWYICALYFYVHENYALAKKYIRQFYKNFYFSGDIADIRQEVRAKLLEARILLKCDPDIISAQSVLEETIELLIKTYHANSFWLIEPYSIYEAISDRYSKDLINLREMYLRKREDANVQLKQFVKEIIRTRPEL